jgi:hypothetical protein
MLMPMCAMHMAMGNFFGRGGAHIGHGAAET